MSLQRDDIKTHSICVAFELMTMPAEKVKVNFKLNTCTPVMSAMSCWCPGICRQACGYIQPRQWPRLLETLEPRAVTHYDYENSGIPRYITQLLMTGKRFSCLEVLFQLWQLHSAFTLLWTKHMWRRVVSVATSSRPILAFTTYCLLLWGSEKWCIHNMKISAVMYI